jgi:hypothetical protein
VKPVDARSIVPVSRRTLERRAITATLRSLLFSLAVLLLTGYGAVMARHQLDVNATALGLATPLLAVSIVATTALGSWSRAWAALEPVSVEAFRWALHQAAQSEESKRYMAELALLGRPMLQHDVWCLEEIQRHPAGSKFRRHSWT